MHYTLKLIISITCNNSHAATISPSAACDALQCMGETLRTFQIICTGPFQQCRQLQCDIQNRSIRLLAMNATLTLLLCNQPAALQLIIYNRTAEISTLYGTSFLTSLMVTVDHPTNSIGIGVNVEYICSRLIFELIHSFTDECARSADNPIHPNYCGHLCLPKK